ncbi:MAG: hypothetical protein KGL26_00935, partial [Pseudomonadota bacterium]|nr:hypothetical protein [Pseudomonadota bacterium]
VLTAPQHYAEDHANYSHVHGGAIGFLDLVMKLDSGIAALMRLSWIRIFAPIAYRALRSRQHGDAVDQWAGQWAMVFFEFRSRS